MSIMTRRSAQVDDLMARARALTPDEIRALVAGYVDDVFGDAGERRGLVSAAVRRAGAGTPWRGPQEEAAAAIHGAAAARAWTLTRLSMLFDAELATADAAVVALLPEHFSEWEAARLAGPWRRVGCG